MSRMERGKLPLFWRGYLIFTLALALFWLWVVWYVADCMRVYEAAQPEKAVMAVSRRLQAGEGAPELDLRGICSRFEEPEDCLRLWTARLEGKELACEKAPDSYDARSPVYTLFAGGEPAASVTLRETSSRQLMFFLTVPEWEVASLAPKLEAGRAALRVTVPEGFTVRVNGIRADERERVEEGGIVEAFRYAAEHIAVPMLEVYEIPALFLEPEIEILDGQGVPARLVRDEDGGLSAWWAPREMDEELEAAVLRNAKNYSNFFSADLPGSAASTAPIRGLFPEGSYYLELAENYRLHDMWMYTPHWAPTFSNEEVSEYIPYSEDFFSCRVSFDKRMILSHTGEERHDISDTRYYYVKIDGTWRIADMRPVLEE